jgi:hypothetical protein
MAARAPDWFEAVKSPNGWTYTINPADRQPSPWPTWSRWLLGAFTIGLIVIGVGLLRSCVAMTSGFAWDGTRVVYGIPRRRGGTRDRSDSAAGQPVRAEARRGGDPRDLVPSRSPAISHELQRLAASR